MTVADTRRLVEAVHRDYRAGHDSGQVSTDLWRSWLTWRTQWLQWAADADEQAPWFRPERDRLSRWRDELRHWQERLREAGAERARVLIPELPEESEPFAAAARGFAVGAGVIAGVAVLFLLSRLG